ncbi:MAG: hypothetical protein WKH68_07270, partial [Candidatus Limnocylindria bacterium]
MRNVTSIPRPANSTSARTKLGSQVPEAPTPASAPVSGIELAAGALEAGALEEGALAAGALEAGVLADGAADGAAALTVID